MNNPALFADFDAVTSDQWKAELSKALRGEPLEILNTNSLEDIPVRPFYRREDTLDLPLYPDLTMPVWSPGLSRKPESAAQEELDSLAAEYGIEHSVDLNPGFPFTRDLPVVSAYGRITDSSTNGLGVRSGNNDPIASLLRNGYWDDAYWSGADSPSSPDNPVYWIDLDVYAESGAHRVQELGYGLGHLVAYLDRYRSGIKPESPPTFLLNTSLAGDFFLDIAKLRAARWLFATIEKQYDLNLRLRILVRPGLRNKTICDYNNNLLRTALECASGIIGGADVVFNLPYDLWFKQANTFSGRLAITQLLLLKHEAHLNESSDLADRVYYIDYLTASLAEKSLDLLRKVQLAGGILNEAQTGNVQREVLHSAGTTQELYDRGDAILLGSNYQMNREEKLADMIESDFWEGLLDPNPVQSFCDAHPSELPRLLPRRWASPWEADLLKQETSSLNRS